MEGGGGGGCLIVFGGALRGEAIDFVEEDHGRRLHVLGGDNHCAATGLGAGCFKQLAQLPLCNMGSIATTNTANIWDCTSVSPWKRLSSSLCMPHPNN